MAKNIVRLSKGQTPVPKAVKIDTSVVTLHSDTGIVINYQSNTASMSMLFGKGKKAILFLLAKHVV